LLFSFIEVQFEMSSRTCFDSKNWTLGKICKLHSVDLFNKSKQCKQYNKICTWRED